MFSAERRRQCRSAAFFRANDSTSDIIQTASLCNSEAVAISKAGAPNSSHTLAKRIHK